MTDDKKTIWLVNNVAGLRVAQKDAIGGQFNFAEFYSESDAKKKLAEGGKRPDLIITNDGSIKEKADGISVITATGMGMKELQAKVEEILPSEIYAKLSMAR
jgi:hypothetical protein